MTTRGIVTLAVLVAAALGSWYLSGGDSTVMPIENGGEVAHRGYYLKSARILGTAADGSPLYEIEAVHAEQREDQSIEFSDVRIAYSPQSEVPWVVDADKATIYPNQEKVLLEGHVRAVSAEGFSGDETEIRTPALELDPTRFVAETDEHVQIRIGTRSLTGEGMLASLNDNRVEIRSNVSGRFVP